MKIKKSVTLCITNMAVAGHGVNLLHIISGETSHYVLVKDLSRLVSRQYNNHNNKKIFPSILFTWLHQWRSIEKLFGKMQVTRGTKNQAHRSWQQEWTCQIQVWKNRIPTTFPFCHLRRFRKHFMETRLLWAIVIKILHLLHIHLSNDCGRRLFYLLNGMVWRGSRSWWRCCIPSIALVSAVS